MMVMVMMCVSIAARRVKMRSPTDHERSLPTVINVMLRMATLVPGTSPDGRNGGLRGRGLVLVTSLENEPLVSLAG